MELGGFSNLGILLAQILIIVVASRLAGRLMRVFGQPAVVGEMIAGIVLGHSVFGLVWPAGFQVVFPAASMPNLYVLAQLGLILFMFVVGMDLRIEHLKSRAKTAVVISHVSIVAPFLLGVGAPSLRKRAFCDGQHRIGQPYGRRERERRRRANLQGHAFDGVHHHAFRGERRDRRR